MGKFQYLDEAGPCTLLQELQTQSHDRHWEGGCEGGWKEKGDSVKQGGWGLEKEGGWREGRKWGLEREGAGQRESGGLERGSGGWKEGKVGRLEREEG